MGFKYRQFCKRTLDFSLKFIKLLQNDFSGQQYACITSNVTIPCQDRIYPQQKCAEHYFAEYISKHANDFQITIPC